MVLRAYRCDLPFSTGTSLICIGNCIVSNLIVFISAIVREHVVGSMTSKDQIWLTFQELQFSWIMFRSSFTPFSSESVIFIHSTWNIRSPKTHFLSQVLPIFFFMFTQYKRISVGPPECEVYFLKLDQSNWD